MPSQRDFDFVKHLKAIDCAQFMCMLTNYTYNCKITVAQSISTNHKRYGRVYKEKNIKQYLRKNNQIMRGQMTDNL